MKDYVIFLPKKYLVAKRGFFPGFFFDNYALMIACLHKAPLKTMAFICF